MKQYSTLKKSMLLVSSHYIFNGISVTFLEINVLHFNVM